MLAAQICQVFNNTFVDFDTQLVGGFDEPFYQADPAQIQFRLDYPRSALHEVAHWCVAGPERRRQDDYGYWYAPDGRDAQQQALFERVEVRPQALEALFCEACGLEFSPSLDNLDQPPQSAAPFAAAIQAQLDHWQTHPMDIPLRGRRFITALRSAR